MHLRRILLLVIPRDRGSTTVFPHTAQLEESDTEMFHDHSNPPTSPSVAATPGVKTTPSRAPAPPSQTDARPRAEAPTRVRLAPSTSGHRRATVLGLVLAAVLLGPAGMASATPQPTAPGTATHQTPADSDPAHPTTANLAAGTPIVAPRTPPATSTPSAPSAPAVNPAPPDEFYRIPAVLPPAPGALIKSTPTIPYIYKAPEAIIPASALRIMYRSTSVHGTPTVITGTTLLPKTAWVGPGKRPLVVVGPATHGLGPQCADSNEMRLGQEREAPIYAALVLAGYAVVITDYEGLGTGLPNTYMAREAQGHAVLDAGRAAIAAGLSGITASSPLLLMGYSQGGAAVASASELATSYAPELHILGAFAGGVPADLTATAKFVDTGTNPSLLFDAALSMATVGHIDLTPYANAKGRDGLAFAAAHCLAEDDDYFANSTSSQYTADGKPFSTLLDAGGPLADTVAAQRIGTGTPPFPMFVGHSPTDGTIPGGQARTMVKQWCSRGARVDLRVTAALSHVDAYVSLIPRILTFFSERTWGVPPTNNCGALPPLGP